MFKRIFSDSQHFPAKTIQRNTASFGQETGSFMILMISAGLEHLFHTLGITIPTTFFSEGWLNHQIFMGCSDDFLFNSRPWKQALLSNSCAFGSSWESMQNLLQGRRIPPKDVSQLNSTPKIEELETSIPWKTMENMVFF